MTLQRKQDRQKNIIVFCTKCDDERIPLSDGQSDDVIKNCFEHCTLSCDSPFVDQESAGAGQLRRDFVEVLKTEKNFATLVVSGESKVEPAEFILNKHSSKVRCKRCTAHYCEHLRIYQEIQKEDDTGTLKSLSAVLTNGVCRRVSCYSTLCAQDSLYRLTGSLATITSFCRGDILGKAEDGLL